MPDNKHVHRNLEFGDPHGSDAKAFKEQVAFELAHRHIGFLADFKTQHRARKTIAYAVFAMGLEDRYRKAALKGHVSKATQRKIRNPILRTPAEHLRESKRKPELRHWRKHHREHPVLPQEVQNAFDDIAFLISKHMSYLWGGDHVTPAGTGPGDCSWCASRIWQRFEAIPTGTTYTLANEGAAGPGEWIKFCIKNIAGEPDESHVIFAIKDVHGVWHWFECGGYDNTQPGNGPCEFHPTDARIAEFTEVRHPVGF